jgi:hypothetical protein
MSITGGLLKAVILNLGLMKIRLVSGSNHCDSLRDPELNSGVTKRDYDIVSGREREDSEVFIMLLT